MTPAWPLPARPNLSPANAQFRQEGLVTQHDAIPTRTTMVMPELGEAGAEGVVARWLPVCARIVRPSMPLSTLSGALVS